LIEPEGAMLWRRGKAYSQDLRERVLAAADEGQRVGRIATMLRVSVSYVSKVLSRRQRTGVTAALPQRCHLPRKLAGLQDAIRAQVLTCPDATLAELRGWLVKTHQVTASTGLLCKTLAELGLTYKKSRCMRLSRPGRMSPKLAANGATGSPA
jgi:transposase